MDIKMLEKYASLAVRAGMNLQDKQQLVINSSISSSGIVFFNSLFDENASCHFAFGEAYPTCLKGSENMTKEQLVESGINDSLIHVDFMIGSSELEIVGETTNGERIHVFRNGEWIL